MKKLIDIPEETRWELEKQATENKMNLKNYIEFILSNLCGGKKNKKKKIASTDADTKTNRH